MSAEGARPAHVVLCGPSGAGKSTVGALLATRLGRPFVDVDREVERTAGRSIAELFRAGEAVFRAREREVALRALGDGVAAVIALGGGALEDDATFAAARAERLVRLDASIATLATRVARDGDRPLLAHDPVAALRALVAAREPRYAAAAVTVRSDAAPPAVADAVLAALAGGVPA